MAKPFEELANKLDDALEEVRTARSAVETTGAAHTAAQARLNKAMNAARGLQSELRAAVDDVIGSPTEAARVR